MYNHVRQLAERDYASRNKLSYDFVIMFIPIESMFLLALDEARVQGRNLWNEAYERRVIIMTPTNLVLAVRLLQDMWRQQRLEANIRAIKERAEKMYAEGLYFVVLKTNREIKTFKIIKQWKESYCIPSYYVYVFWPHVLV